MNFDKNGLLNGISNADYQKLFTAWKADQATIIHVLMVVLIIGAAMVAIGAILAFPEMDVLGITFIVFGVMAVLIGGGVCLTTSYNLHNNPELHFIQSFTNGD